MSEPKNLVIVESPAKAKTIEKYLGKNYKVKASMGHLRDLPKSTMGVDLETFEPKYIAVRDRAPLIKELKAEAKKADVVFLATDPDREGEAISWHLKELLSLPDEKAKRVTFNEITKNVVTNGIKNPRDIDSDLVNAQQARRVLDRIVGYELSPMLWRVIKYGLSAGRVQSVAVRMVVDRENEIRNFVKEEYWHIDAVLSPEKGGSFVARYFAPEGSEKKSTLRSEDEVKKIIAEIEKAPFVVKSVKRSEKTKSPAPPFITSTLQQEASRRLNMTPRRTMMIAQQLYEGVEISGRGSIGLITYMRTDSLRLSDEALSAAGKYIRSVYGESLYPGKPRTFKTKAGAQDAHEAIRPTDVFLSPDVVKGDLTKDQYALYRLIWNRFTASQMSNAVYDSVQVDVVSAGHDFRANCSEIKFKGYTALYEEAKDEESDELSNPLPGVDIGDVLTPEKISSDQQFTQPPARYTEATLIRAMEEKGIGRPSTYAATVTTITSHDYVVKEGRYLQPTPLGETVTEFLMDKFPDIVDLGFTSTMEENLDKVESGSTDWKNLLREFYGFFSSEMTKAESETGGVKIKVPDVETDEICELCGSRLVKKKGRFGYFLACPKFPECTFTKPLVIEMPGKCPKCGGKLLKRNSRNGNAYYACEDNKALCSFRITEKPEAELCPKCGGKIVESTDERDGSTFWACENNLIRKCGFITWDVPTKEFCPACGKTMFKRSGKGQAKTFCENEECIKFVPLDMRGYKKKSADGAADAEKKTSARKKAAPAKKSASSGKKTAAGKTASSAKKTAAEKTGAGSRKKK
ncbi:MAG: type I DNA topoisomerase [Eubacteriales bacterium]|nr:type I DNA topoisomerase [Eubacteriales bacterium]